MRASHHFLLSVVVGSCAGLLAGCASGTATAILSPTTELLKQPAALVTGGLSALGSIELPKPPELDPDPIGRPTELYARIAKGATRCWFGGEGHLKPTHIFNAVAEPEGKGGQAEIVIHEKAPAMPDPRGRRAFRVTIEAAGDGATVAVENARFPADEGAKMEREVRRWARGDDACSPRAVAAAQTPAVAPAPVTKPKTVQKPVIGSGSSSAPKATAAPTTPAPQG